MKKLFITFLLIAGCTAVNAQQAKQEIFENINLSASNYLAYPGPTQEKLTPAPKGYKPFYISHYGRHGSRYLIGDDDYDMPVSVLSEADKQGKLTNLGKDVLRRVKMLREESRNRTGELTELGAEQHKQIAKRMYERFPEVFKGAVHVDAKSTVVIRCILSMENALQQLLEMNPQLIITHDASKHDMYYMNQTDEALKNKKAPRRSNVMFDEYKAKHPTSERLLNTLFNDKDYIKYEIDGVKLADVLFKLASNLQSSELRKQITLYDIFTKDEIYENWLKNNTRWYMTYGNFKFNGGTQPFSQRNLLRTIIHQADSCIQIERPGATLRFGHETMVLPLTCLLGLNGYDQQIDNLDEVESKGWINYKVFPMGANIQFIFYRKSFGGDVLVKVLLNENETTLPIHSDIAPYYRWNDVKEYYTKKLDSYKE